MKKARRGHPFITTVIAVVILTGLSVIDWKELSAGRIKNFNLIEDILLTPSEPEDLESESETITIDPILHEAIAEISAERSEVKIPAEPHPQEQLVMVSDSDSIAEVLHDEKPQILIPVKTEPIKVGRVDGIQPIEDYSPDGDGICRLRRALENTANRRSRIAVIGDSYIEGDIFTQDIRRMLQEEYGGYGVGYMAMHSEFPGFRRSVNQSDRGWTAYDIRNRNNDPLRPLSGEYCVASDGAVSTFTAPKNEEGKWHVNRFIYIAPNGGSVSVKTDLMTETYPLEAGDSIQALEITGETGSASFTIHGNGVKVLGVWLEDNFGVGVDCMSLRGNSGVTHRTLSQSVAAEMNKYIPYDLIIVEYGLNALSAAQKNYSNYGQVMSKVVQRIKECFPTADILMLGVGDRGWKKGSSVNSMPTIEAIISAQRKCAIENGILFWDTRNAMGGENAIVDWRKRGLVNADYIHMNHKGGNELAKEFINSLKMKLNETN